MRRRFIAAAWIAGAVIPLAAGTLFVVGCCVLPFHRVVHAAMPACHLAVKAMAGENDAPATPAPQKQEPVKRFVSQLSPVFRLVVNADLREVIAPSAATAYRSFISLGAMRCDRDVGLHVLVDTYRI
jgi:hypothetical protein